MKKLIIAGVVAFVAVVTQAATVNWTCTNVYAGNDATKATGKAYLMLASDVADFNSLKGKGATAINAALANALYSYTPSAEGTYSIAAENAIPNATLGLSDSTSYGNAYLVIFDTTTVTDASKFYVTKTVALETLEGDNNVKLSFGSQATASKSADNWSAAAAPEPTSGLLLLLGMAGLALKRKRA